MFLPCFTPKVQKSRMRQSCCHLLSLQVAAQVSRALELLGRLKIEDNQFKARTLMIRCLHEARSGIGKLSANRIPRRECILTKQYLQWLSSNSPHAAV